MESKTYIQVVGSEGEMVMQGNSGNPEMSWSACFLKSVECSCGEPQLSSYMLSTAVLVLQHQT